MRRNEGRGDERGEGRFGLAINYTNNVTISFLAMCRFFAFFQNRSKSCSNGAVRCMAGKERARWLHCAMIEGWEGVLYRSTSVRSSRYDVRFFWRRTKRYKTMPKWRRMVLCFAGGEGASVIVALCHDKRARIALLSSYEHSKFVTQDSIFERRAKSLETMLKRGRTMLCFCTRGRGERCCCRTP